MSVSNEQVLEALNSFRNEVRADLHRLDKILRGCGDEQMPGVLTRVDRLEQIEKSRKWHIRALAAGVLGGIGTWLAGKITGAHP